MNVYNPYAKSQMGLNVQVLMPPDPNSTRKNYTQLEKEWLSCIFWYKQILFLPVWTSVFLITDHKPLRATIILAQAYVSSGISKSTPMIVIVACL